MQKLEIIQSTMSRGGSPMGHTLLAFQKQMFEEQVRLIKGYLPKMTAEDKRRARSTLQFLRKQLEGMAWVM